jgi:hypothetical protein
MIFCLCQYPASTFSSFLFITFICFLLLFLYWIIIIYLFLHSFCVKVMYLPFTLLFAESFNNIFILFYFLPLPYLRHLLTSILFLVIDSSSFLFLVVYIFILSFFFPVFACLGFVFFVYLFIITLFVTALQVGRTRLRFPLVSLGFFVDLILPAAL